MVISASLNYPIFTATRFLKVRSTSSMVVQCPNIRFEILKFIHHVAWCYRMNVNNLSVPTRQMAANGGKLRQMGEIDGKRRQMAANDAVFWFPGRGVSTFNATKEKDKIYKQINH